MKFTDSEGDKTDTKDYAAELNYQKLEDAIETLANKVANLAVKLDEHLKERDAHNAAMMGKK